jgi:predicted dehydrogenase
MERISAGFPQVRIFADAASVIEASDCVYIAPPPASHLVHARAALAADRTFFGEKPLSIDVADARVFVAQAGERGAVNFPFASSPGVASLKEWLAKGEIGKPARIRIEVAFARLAPLLADRCGWMAGQAGARRFHARSRFAFPGSQSQADRSLARPRGERRVSPRPASRSVGSRRGSWPMTSR